MSTQTFSKVFLFPNNKRKTKNNFPITTGPAHGNDWPTAAFGLLSTEYARQSTEGYPTMVDLSVGMHVIRNRMVTQGAETMI